MKNQAGFGFAVRVNDRMLHEQSGRDGNTWVAALPGQRYSICVFLPRGKVYGLILRVDGKPAYGNDHGMGIQPAAIDMKTDDLSENELPGWYVNAEPIEACFMFANRNPADAPAAGGIIEAAFYDNAYVAAEHPGLSRGSNLVTVGERKEGVVIADPSLEGRYRKGELLYVKRLHYATQDFIDDLKVQTPVQEPHQA